MDVFRSFDEYKEVYVDGCKEVYVNGLEAARKNRCETLVIVLGMK